MKRKIRVCFCSLFLIKGPKPLAPKKGGIKNKKQTSIRYNYVRVIFKISIFLAFQT